MTTKTAPTSENPPSDADVNLGLDRTPDPAAEDPGDATAKTSAEPGTDPGPVDAKNRKSAYLPVLPDGWRYEVTIHGPGGATVELSPQSLPNGDSSAASPHQVTYSPAGEAPRRIDAADLAEAARMAASGVKVLDRVYRGEQEVRKAREEALSVLGHTTGAPASAGTESTAPADR